MLQATSGVHVSEFLVVELERTQESVMVVLINEEIERLEPAFSLKITYAFFVIGTLWFLSNAAGIV
jgi:hypothetical protein